jgi:nanoRNase/pAp phosphatase (c-di-AMP/oligoRNAs hydrolase)
LFSHKPFMEQELQKAREIIAKSDHIGLLLPAHPDADCYTAAEALVRTMEALGKHTGFLPGRSPDAARVQDACTHMLNPAPLVREFVIGIATAEVPVSQLRYEKHDDRIDIVLSPRSSPIREDSFSFREGKIQCDCIIALGLPDIETLPALDTVDPSFFTETPILVIGNDPDQKSYGEINLVSPPDVPLSETVAALAAGNPGRAPDADTATILLAGIIAHTDGFRAPVQAHTHAAVASLLGLGARHDDARAIAAAEESFGMRQLAARAVVRSKETNGGRVLWSFLTSDDFEKTARTGADIAYVARALAQSGPARRISVLLWHDKETGRVRVSAGGDSEVVGMLNEREPGTIHGALLTLTADFASFVEAEERIASLLREIL